MAGEQIGTVERTRTEESNIDQNSKLLQDNVTSKFQSEYFPQINKSSDLNLSDYMSKCGDSSKCYNPAPGSIDLSGADIYRFTRGPNDQLTARPDVNNPSDPNRDLEKEVDKLVAKDIASSLSNGNMTDLRRNLELLSGDPKLAERVMKELQESLALRNIDVKFEHGKDRYGNPTIKLELSKNNDFSKSSGFTSFAYSSDGTARGEYRPTGNFVTTSTRDMAPAQALEKIMKQSLSK